MLTNFQSSLELAAKGRKRFQRSGESRGEYITRARRVSNAVKTKLAETGEYRHCHESFLVRDTLLVIEQLFPDLGTFGVEYIARGTNQRSPAITYLNTGDSCDLTVLYVNGRFRVGTWGDIVERGSYS
jgi:hypothetical protein